MEEILKQDSAVLAVRQGDLVRKTVYGIDPSGPFIRTPAEERVNREIRALEMLKDLEGIQRFVKRESPNSFYSIFMTGVSLLEANGRATNSYFDNLEELHEECFRRGVYRVGQNRADFIIRPNGSPGIIDFGNVAFSDDLYPPFNSVFLLAVRKYTSIRLKNLRRRLAS